jgi:hypothetical protein
MNGKASCFNTPESPKRHLIEGGFEPNTLNKVISTGVISDADVVRYSQPKIRNEKLASGRPTFVSRVIPMARSSLSSSS